MSEFFILFSVVIWRRHCTNICGFLATVECKQNFFFFPWKSSRWITILGDEKHWRSHKFNVQRWKTPQRFYWKKIDWSKRRSWMFCHIYIVLKTSKSQKPLNFNSQKFFHPRSHAHHSLSHKDSSKWYRTVRRPVKINARWRAMLLRCDGVINLNFISDRLEDESFFFGSYSNEFSTFYNVFPCYSQRFSRD